MIFKKTMCLMIACVLILFCACGNQGINDMSQETIPQYTLPPVEVEPVPTQGGELVFPIPENPATLNPLKIKNVELYNLFSMIYEQPLRIGVDGKPQPQLVETWDKDETGTVWTFNLRKGVHWQKGYGEFTSADIIYTIDLIKSYSNSDSTYAQYNSMISNYTAINDYEITITLSTPGNAVIYFMTFPVLCRAYGETGSIDTLLPVGTGPYLVVEYETSEEMLLQANDVWWKEAPFIQTLTASCYLNHDTELVAFEENLLDFITTPVLTVDTYKKYGETESIDYLTQYYDCLIPNVTGGIFDDLNMRQALGYALDKREIISTALLGHAVATDYPVAPDSYLTGESSNIYEYNLQKATELLEQSGWKDRDDDGILEKVEGTDIYDLKFELLIPLNKDDTYRLDVAENIVYQLKKCGMDVEVVEKPSEEYTTRLENGFFDIALCSFYLDQNPNVEFMIGTDGAANYGNFADAELDGLLQNCKLALDDEQIATAFLAMENHFIQQAPQISLYFKTNALIFQTSINISDNLRDMNIYTTIPDWYLFVTEQEALS